MPTDKENIKFLFTVLMHGGDPTINWDPVCEALHLKKGAVTKRWSRLKKAMEQGEEPSASAYQFLWLCVKNNTRIQTFNWQVIADQCDTTPAAASKRYSRMKQAFDAGDAAPTSARNTPVKNTSTTPKSVPLAAPGDDDEAATPTPKRKRATPKKKAINTDDEKFKPESDLEDDEDMLTPSKRAKVSKSKTKNQTKASDTVMKRNSPTTEATASINNEVDDDEVFHDAQEHTEGTEGIDDVQDDGVQDWRNNIAWT